METRNTIQRSLVLQAVNHLRHPTADEIYHMVHREHPNISRGTVYRNLNLLVEQGKVRRVRVPDAADRFDFTLGNHYHIRCKVCGVVEDADLPYQEHILENLPISNGFLVEDHDIMLTGICPRCRQGNMS